MSIIKPGRNRRKKMIEQILRDLDPSIREEARRVIEEVNPREPLNREKIIEILRKKRILP